MSDKGEIKPDTNKPAVDKKPVTKPSANSSSKGNGFLTFFVLIIFLLVIGGLGAGYYFWELIQKDLQTARTERAELKNAFAALDKNPAIKKMFTGVEKQIKSTKHDLLDLNDQFSSLEEEHQRISEIATATSETVNRGQIGWMLHEVQHVLRMAQHRLLLDRDIKGALAGLDAADQRLSQIDDLRLIPIRKSIANQILALQEYSHPDYIGLQLKLDNAIASLRTGLVSSPKPATESATPTEDNATEAAPHAEESTTPPAEVALNYVKDTFDKAKAAFNKTVKVTHGEQQISLYIEEQEKKRAYEFLRQKLLGAKYAISTRDDSSFHKQLGAALAWLESNETAFTNKQKLLNEITSINKIDLLPELPDISEPSSLMEIYIANHKEK
jgi:uroporphyrin-3 C-methyltransferase